MVSVIADKSTGMILEVNGSMPFSTHRYRRGYEDDCVRKNGGRLKTYLEGILGPPSGDRYLNKSANVSEKPKSGRYCHQYTWRRGCQIIGLSLWYDDGKDGCDGEILLDVFRTDMGVKPVEWPAIEGFTMMPRNGHENNIYNGCRWEGRDKGDANGIHLEIQDAKRV